MSTTSNSLESHGNAFAELHSAKGAFIIPNPWDIGSACMLEAMGFRALATTSAGLAFDLGKTDGAVGLEEIIEHCHVLCGCTSLPVSADLENCYADDPRSAAANLLRVAETGIVGASIEDYSGDDEHPIYDLSLAVERVAAAVEAVRTLPHTFTLTARAENLFRGRDDMDDTIERLQAFEKAGADVLYAPGLRTLEQVAEVTRSLERPVNVLVPPIPGATVADLARVGAKRLSLGGALSRATLAPLIRAGKEMREHGTFTWTQDLASVGDIEALLKP